MDLGSPVKIRILMLLARTQEDLSRYAVDKGAQASDKDAARAQTDEREEKWGFETYSKLHHILCSFRIGYF